MIDAQLEVGYASGSGFRDAVARLIGESPAALRGRDLLRADWIKTPVGSLRAVADRHALHLLEFCDRRALLTELTRLRTVTRAAIAFGRLQPIDQMEAELRHDFAGDGARFATPLALHGSAFTRAVWEVLQAIPPGTTRFYAEVAAAADRLQAARATARANGANQVAILIPASGSSARTAR